MQRPTSELILSVGVRYDAAILVSRSRSQTTSKDGFQVELIPTTGSTNTEMAHLSKYVSRVRLCRYHYRQSYRLVRQSRQRLCENHVIPLLRVGQIGPQFASMNIGPTTAHDVQLTQNHSTFYPALACCSNLSAACPRKGPVSLCSKTPSLCRYAHI